MMPRTLGRICTMGYYSDFDIDITIEGISKGEVEDIVERTFGERIAEKLTLGEAGNGAFIVGNLYSIKWYSFTEDMEELQKAIAKSGGKFVCTCIERQGEDSGDGERFVNRNGKLARQVTLLTWVDSED